MALLEVTNLNLCFEQGGNNKSKVHAVRDVSFSLEQGECLAIVGESGCGKSACLKSILALNGKNAKRTGFINYKQQALHEFSEQAMQKVRGKQIAMIFQDPMSALNPTMTIGQQIAEAIKNRDSLSKHDIKQKVIELLQETGISKAKSRLEQYPFEFSGGMLQRVVIAMALAGEPEIILADEPTTALDVTIQKQIIELIKTVQQKRVMSLILVSHNLALVSQIADRIIVMYAGEIVECAYTKDLFSKPRHPYTQALLKSLPEFSLQKQIKNLHVIEGSPPDLSQEFHVCAFVDRCSQAMKVCAKHKPHFFEKNGHTNRCWLEKR